MTSRVPVCYPVDVGDVDRERRRRYRQRHPEIMRERRRRNRQRHPEKFRAIRKRYRERNREKFKARQVVAFAVRHGLLVKRPCAVCRKRSVEAHHEDYAKPLEVIWLCAPHHRARHES